MSHQSDLIATDINAYLEQHQNKELLRFLTCGSVDDGKSTLIGRLLHDSKMIYEDQLAAIEKDSQKSGTTGEKVDLALLVDGLQAEREQGITIDVAYRYFSTAKRKFIIADTPGHEQYTRNMATGASTCDLAIILIDARHGVMTQTRRHSFIAHLLGLKHLIVAVNKMDLVEFSEQRFEEIKADYLAFAEQLSIPDIQFVPMSALEGDNVVNASENMPWFKGQTMMQLLETTQIANDESFEGFRLPVQYVNRPNLNFRGFAGTIAAGRIKPGDKVVALPSGQSSSVDEIVTFDGNLDEAHVGQAVTVTLNDEIDISRGDMLVKAGEQPMIGQSFETKLVWMNEAPLVPGRQYYFKIGHQLCIGSVTQINEKIDVNTLETSRASELELNSIATVTIHLNKQVVVDAYQQNKHTGEFIMIDRLSNGTVAAGMIEKEADAADQRLVSDQDRKVRYQQSPVTVVVNNAELAVQLEQRLFNRGHAAVIVRAEDALTVCPYIEAAGLIAIVAGSEQKLPFGITLNNNAVDELLDELKTQSILLEI
ncbi:sulfate adenylyltransferase subunit CysN [Reinekea thalattae]|uniref:Sulfate adenylyltransferase subunit 1 n=1 Tax=Reinekea thalattae TaxID=2593301 RepID=A0A5C8Z1Z6_9GAMM|nr:sulfate adenylyltransferase subunit CysN [Reinekea thalattae]TXR52182.1 sulfate adenylyltransferase subunit CysN [Reinekea thalattae]